MTQVKQYKQCLREKSFETICERDCFNCKFTFYFGKEKFKGTQVPMIILTGEQKNDNNKASLRTNKKRPQKKPRNM